MLTKKVKNKLKFTIFFSFLVITSFLFVKSNLEKNFLYFKTPTEISKMENVEIGKNFRVGGMVKKNSVISNQNDIKFIITDFKNEIFVTYTGTVPNLFLEGKGVIAEGALQDKKYFVADKILAKHDENYMPPELKNVKKK
tara:strand:+ start:400 stop:819 length:420 start_codon:yes stop_codon:yes gene_type:complete